MKNAKTVLFCLILEPFLSSCSHPIPLRSQDLATDACTIVFPFKRVDGDGVIEQVTESYICGRRHVYLQAHSGRPNGSDQLRCSSEADWHVLARSSCNLEGVLNDKGTACLVNEFCTRTEELARLLRVPVTELTRPPVDTSPSIITLGERPPSPLPKTPCRGSQGVFSWP